MDLAGRWLESLDWRFVRESITVDRMVRRPSARWRRRCGRAGAFLKTAIDRRSTAGNGRYLKELSFFFAIEKLLVVDGASCGDAATKLRAPAADRLTSAPTEEVDVIKWRLVLPCLHGVPHASNYVWQLTSFVV